MQVSGGPLPEDNEAERSLDYKICAEMRSLAGMGLERPCERQRRYVWVCLIARCLGACQTPGKMCLVSIGCFSDETNAGSGNGLWLQRLHLGHYCMSSTIRCTLRKLTHFVRISFQLFYLTKENRSRVCLRFARNLRDRPCRGCIYFWHMPTSKTKASPVGASWVSRQARLV